jgi:hypothetical protein
MASLAYRLSQITFRCIDWVQGMQHLEKLLKSIYFAARRLRSRNLDRPTILRLDNDSLTAREAFIPQQWFVLFLAAVTDDWRLALVWCAAKCELRFGPDAMGLDHNIQIHREFSIRFLMYMAMWEMRLLVRIQQVLMANIEGVVRGGYELMNGLPLPVLLGQFLFE